MSTGNTFSKYKNEVNKTPHNHFDIGVASITPWRGLISIG